MIWVASLGREVIIFSYGLGRSLRRFFLVRKRLVTQLSGTPQEESPWLRLAEIALVEFTSEDPEHPIESAIRLESTSGWRAGSPGEQTIRLLFDEPQNLRCIRLVFEEALRQREQEFVLSWSREHSGPLREIVRQEYNFSPSGATQELEQYGVELDRLKILQLRIVPDRDGGDALASLEQLRVA
jgi:hypothetical protein